MRLSLLKEFAEESWYCETERIPRSRWTLIKSILQIIYNFLLNLIGQSSNLLLFLFIEFLNSAHHIPESTDQVDSSLVIALNSGLILVF